METTEITLCYAVLVANLSVRPDVILENLLSLKSITQQRSKHGQIPEEGIFLASDLETRNLVDQRSHTTPTTHRDKMPNTVQLRN